MHTFLNKAVLATALLLPAAFASAGGAERETRAVDAQVNKVKLGGVINLQLRQGNAPSLVLYGDKEYLAKVTVTQAGDTLTIGTSERNWNFSGRGKELRAELTLPQLQAFHSNGVGSSDVQGFSGASLKLDLDGAGAVTVIGNYRNIDARLGGVGSMTLNTAEADRVDLDMHGAGQISVSGNTKLLKANLGGVGALDAKKLRADSVELDMTGLGGASVYAKTSANLQLRGLGSATVYGKPANRVAAARGLGSVSWE